MGEGLSVCEAILLDDRFKDMRKEHVGVAKVFWSHVQIEGLIGLQKDWEGTLAPELSPERGTFFIICAAVKDFVWCDYFSLRQCQHDFDVDAIIELIGNMDEVVSCMNPIKGYISRSFCVFETYAAVYNNVPLRVIQTMSTDRAELERILAPSNPDDGCILGRYWAGSVKSAQSDTEIQTIKRLSTISSCRFQMGLRVSMRSSRKPSSTVPACGGLACPLNYFFHPA